MIHTALVDRAGYVTQVWQNKHPATLDARAYAHLGDLVGCTGPVVAGMRYVNGGFYAAPSRPNPAWIKQEAERRIELHFPSGFRRQIEALGGDNALKMSTYIRQVTETATGMMAADLAPTDFKSDHWWPHPPLLTALQVPQRVIEHQAYQAAAAQPITVHVAPVINAGERGESGGNRGLPALVQHEAVSTGQEPHFEPVSNVRSLPVKRPPTTTVEPINDGESDGRSFGGDLDRRDPLYALKLALVQAIAATAEKHRNMLADSTVHVLAEIAALGTAATTQAQVNEQRARVKAVIEGLAA